MAIILLSCLSLAAVPVRAAAEAFENIEFMQPNGDSLRETDVRIEFDDSTMRVIKRSNRAVLKEWNYSDIESAEYSYTKNPRWKTGLGLGAAAILFPPLLFIAIPIGFTKHRRHWVTIRTGDDYAVFKVGKGVRKLFMPAFETRTSIQIQALGDDK
ncbi:MAG: hypothetical protein DMF63_11035 [Acidobacteria bacterium]|nr:MAG: hypothetical protein DMF63_11035 [Acidobacteriota bacterium]